MSRHLNKIVFLELALNGDKQYSVYFITSLMYRQMKKAILTSYPTDLEIQQSILHNMSFA